MLGARRVGFLLSVVASSGFGCSTDEPSSRVSVDAGVVSGWQTVHSELSGGLMSVWGRGPRDVWAVGSDTQDGKGALILHYDGSGWQRHVLGLERDIWWVHGFDDGTVFFGGSSGTVITYREGRFVELSTPGRGGTATVFGVWGTSSSDVWAVGGDTLGGTGGFVWRYDGERFRAVEVPLEWRVASYFKVWGTASGSVWVVGTEGTVVAFDDAGWSQVATGARDPYFTVHASERSTPRVAAVGGYDLGIAVEQLDGPDTWRSVALPGGTRQLFGVWLTDSTGYAVGDRASVLSIGARGWEPIATGLATTKALHAVWVDSDDGIWAVGGDVLVPPLGAGVLVHRGLPVETTLTDVEQELHVIAVTEPRDAGIDGRPPEDRPDATPTLPDATPPDSAAEEPDAAPEPPRVPGTIRCGDDDCEVGSEVCCFDRLWVEEPRCYPIPDAGFDLACPAGSGRFPASCDQNADCPSGDVCCLTVFFQGGGVRRTECASSCVTHDLCDTSAECSGGQCTELSFAPEFDQCF